MREVVLGISAWLMCGIIALGGLAHVRPDKEITIGTSLFFVATGPIPLVVLVVVLLDRHVLTTCIANCKE